MEEVAQQCEGDLDEDQEDHDRFEAGRVLVVELAGEDLEELVDDVEAFVEDLDALGDVEIVGGAPVERLEFGIVPEEFRRVEDFAVKVDEVAFDEDLAHFLGDLLREREILPFWARSAGSFFVLSMVLWISSSKVDSFTDWAMPCEMASLVSVLLL